MNAHLSPADSLQSLKGAPADTLRPLSAIAATRRGLVPQARIIRVVADLAGPLARLHAEGAIHGAISYDSVALNAQGGADIALPPAAAPQGLGDAALAEGRALGYNAFEQYTDDPGWAVGPWTDVYALGAVACMLIAGAPPPSAIDRYVRDTFVPLSARGLEHYTPAFLAGVDKALALRPEDRPSSMAALLAALGYSLTAADEAVHERDKVAEDCEPSAQAGSDALAFTADRVQAPSVATRAVIPPPAPLPPRQWPSWLFVPTGLGLALLIVYLWLSWSSPFIPRLADAPQPSGQADGYTESGLTAAPAQAGIGEGGASVPTISRPF